jgi:hypothetical protein
MLRDTVDVSADDVSSGSENAGAVWWEGDAPGRDGELEMSFESFHGPVAGVEVPCFGCWRVALEETERDYQLRKRMLDIPSPAERNTWSRGQVDDPLPCIWM